MKADRQAFAALLRQLHSMGVTSAAVSCSVCKGQASTAPCRRCDDAGYDHVSSGAVLTVLGEMMGVDTAPIGFDDVLTAAKRAGVY